MDNRWQRRLILLGSAFFAGYFTYVFLPRECPESARRMAFVFIFAAFLWVFEIIPLFVTSLLTIFLEYLLLARSSNISYTTFLAPLANPVIILFLGGFVLARAFQKYRVDAWLVTNLLHLFGPRPYFVLFGFMAATAFLGMWLSNTATTALMLAMIYPLLSGLGPQDIFKKALILAIPFAARIGGITTPVGSPTNAVAIGLLAERGISVHFLTWTAMTLPLAILLLLSTSAILYFLFPPQKSELVFSIEKPDGFDWQAKVVIAIGCFTAFLWLSASWHHIPEAMTALFCLILLAGTRLLDTDDIKKIDWDILLLMWGGLALGEGMEKSGLAVWVTGLHIFPHPGWQLNLMVCLVTVFLSTFMSNTATVNLLVPIALSMPGGDPRILAALVALAASFDLALPISTPPMAMAYGTKEVSIGDMVKAGTIFAIFANVLLLLGVEVMMKNVFIRGDL